MEKLLERNLDHDPSSPDVKVEIIPHKGRGLVTAREFKTDEIILREKPLLKGPSQNCENVCAECLDIPESKFELCENCQMVQICSECDGHISRECSLLDSQAEALSPKIRQEISRTSAKWLTLWRAFCQEEASEFNEIFDQLQSSSYRKGREEASQKEASEAVARLLGGKVSQSQVLDAAAKMDANAFRVGGGGRCVYGLASMINHDCASNAKVRFGPGEELTLVAKRDLAPDEEVTISYCPPLYSTRERRLRLVRSKGFRCECARCQDPTEDDTYMGAITCTRCGGYMLDLETAFACEKCPFRTTADKAGKLFDAVSRAQNKIMGGKVASVEELERLLSAHAKRLPPTNWLMLDFKNRMMMTPNVGAERKLELLEERAAALERVDGPRSRMMGFLMFRKCCFLMETEGQEGEIVKCLSTAKELLAGDARRPPQLDVMCNKFGIK